jgi:hypothetical protein
VSYTNGAITVPLSGLEQLILTDPSVWNGQDLGFSAHDIYVAGDYLEFDFNGPQLFSGPTSAPTVGTGSFVGQQAWYGFSARYLGGSDYSYAQLVGNATLTLTSTPEPSTGLLITLALGAALLQFISRTAKWDRFGGNSGGSRGTRCDRT